MNLLACSLEPADKFNELFPSTLLYEHRVPDGPRAGRWMPVWMGAKEVAKERPELLKERGVTAMMSFMQTGGSRKWVHKDFECPWPLSKTRMS